MNRIIPSLAAIALALSLPLSAEAQNQGQGKGAERAQDKGGGRGGDDRPGRGGENRGRGQDRPDREFRTTAPVMREVARGPEIRDEGPGRGRDDLRVDRPAAPGARASVALDRDVGPIDLFRADRQRGLIAGCPPGLAKRHNGCLPPGQERKIARARYADLWDRDGDWRYENGYLYQFDPGGSVKGWLPALGGALAPGAVWPTQYAWQPVPQYYTEYFGLNAPMDYRYANGALYGVDPQTQAISQVVALLTGQPISVGQPMPAGYDVYNVPYPYRDQYVDTATARYRYNDGYVYRVDPTTQLVQAAIQLLT